jgi:hypothetical protein
MLKRSHLPDATNSELVRYARSAEKDDHDLLRAIHDEANARVEAQKKEWGAAVRAYKAVGGRPGHLVRGAERDALKKAGEALSRLEKSLRPARGRKYSGRGPF